MSVEGGLIFGGELVLRTKEKRAKGSSCGDMSLIDGESISLLPPATTELNDLRCIYLVLNL
jgi:hypothetical protein